MLVYIIDYCEMFWKLKKTMLSWIRFSPVFFSSSVKPSPPSVLEATTLPNKTLSVSWRRPHLPVYDMQYELRIVALRGMANTQWKVGRSFWKLGSQVDNETRNLNAMLHA